MAGERKGPLTDEHFAQLKEATTMLDEAEREMQRARAAGVDLGDAPQRVVEYRKQINQIKAVYGPNKR